MEKTALASASSYNQKYYLNPEFDNLPINIKTELKRICVPLAEKLHCIFTIGFYTNGEIYIETQAYETDINYDEIGSQLEIKNLQKHEQKLFKSLELWYIIYKTPKGEQIKKNYIK